MFDLVIGKYNVIDYFVFFLVCLGVKIFQKENGLDYFFSYFKIFVCDFLFENVFVCSERESLKYILLNIDE